MDSATKKTIYDILTDKSLSIEEKYQEIIKRFPDYQRNIEEKKCIFEKIEGFFHDGLGTYFEYLVHDEIIKEYKLNKKYIGKEEVIKKMQYGISLYKKFFPTNSYGVNYEKEISNIEKGAINSLKTIKQCIPFSKVIDVQATAQEFRIGNVRDLFIKLENNQEINFSLKVDKSGKFALSEGQTPVIFEKVYKRYFQLTENEYKELKLELFNTEDEDIIFNDFQNVALLTQVVIIKKLGVIDGGINDLGKAKITNINALRYLIQKLNRYRSGNDNAITILVNRLNGEIGEKSILDDIELVDIDLNDFSFTPSHKKKRLYNTEPGIKYKGKKFVSFQTKHKRGKNPSIKFGDITIRLITK